MIEVQVHKCPACREESEAVRVPPRGFVQTFVLLRLGFHPHRCLACGARYVRLRRSSSGQPSEGVEASFHPIPLVEKQFLSAQDRQQFQDLIGEIKKAEKWSDLESAEGEDQEK